MVVTAGEVGGEVKKDVFDAKNVAKPFQQTYNYQKKKRRRLVKYQSVSVSDFVASETQLWLWSVVPYKWSW